LIEKVSSSPVAALQTVHCVDLPKAHGYRFPVPERHELRGVPKHMYNTQLNFHLRKYLSNGLAKSKKTIHRRKQNILHAPNPDLVQDL